MKCFIVLIEDKEEYIRWCRGLERSKFVETYNSDNTIIDLIGKDYSVTLIDISHMDLVKVCIDIVSCMVKKRIPYQAIVYRQIEECCRDMYVTDNIIAMNLGHDIAMHMGIESNIVLDGDVVHTDNYYLEELLHFSKGEFSNEE